ncbi:MAG TPA: hypothetical protein VMH20_05600 [Verrucomicrobiae bacterium]|nr:hypothetical protein [Verrucomicrobiae bacterium]
MRRLAAGPAVAVELVAVLLAAEAAWVGLVSANLGVLHPEVVQPVLAHPAWFRAQVQ